MPDFIRQRKSDCLIDAYVVPNANKNEIAGEYRNRLRVRLAAPPVDGKANACLIRFFSKLLNIPKKDVSLTKGQSSRMKTVLIVGCDVEKILRTLGIQSG